MSKRKGDLWWVSSPGTVGLLVVPIIIVVPVIIASLAMTGRYLEAVLATSAGVFFLSLAILDLLGELLGSLRDLRGVLERRGKEDTGQHAEAPLEK